jgi:hypothetical protein
MWLFQMHCDKRQKIARVYSLVIKFCIVYEVNYMSLFRPLCTQSSGSPLIFQAIGGMQI